MCVFSIPCELLNRDIIGCPFLWELSYFYKSCIAPFLSLKHCSCCLDVVVLRLEVKENLKMTSK